MWKITNTANDRTKVALHRTASKFLMEPSIGGVRIQLGQSILITDEQYERLKKTLDGWVAKGMVDVDQVNEKGEKVETKAAPEAARRETAPLPPAEVAPPPPVVEVAVPPPPADEPAPSVDWEPGAVASDTVADEGPSEAPKAEGHSKKGSGKKKLF